MITAQTDTVLAILRQHGRDGHIERSPRSGHLRIGHLNNDVLCAIENMGGLNAAAKTLGLSVNELNRWIDDHYIPRPYALAVKAHTGFSIESLQRPTFYVFDGCAFWPRPPAPEEWAGETGPCIYITKQPAAASNKRAGGRLQVEKIQPRRGACLTAGKRSHKQEAA